MWIFCCGAKGAGSTLKFNLVSTLVERSGVGKKIEWDSSLDFSSLRERYQDYSGFKVVNTHRLPHEMETSFLEKNAIGFYTYRDFRNVLITRAKEDQQPLDPYLNEPKYPKEYINHFFEWQKITNVYKSKYEDVVIDIDSEIQRIQKVLNLPTFSEEIVQEISQKFSIKTKFQPDDQKDWRTVFTEAQNELIEKKAGEWLFNNGYELKTKAPNTKLYSYAQHGDDDYIWKYFDKKKKGLIIEVGAFDGIHFSNSYSLENIGWRSLCMEPTPVMYKKLIANRPKAECFNLAVVGDEDINQIDFLSEELGLLSGVNIDVEDVKSRYKRRGLAFKEPEKIKVKAKTLNAIFGELKLKPTEIDCITIDVEGFEMDVLRGFDLDVFKPQLIIIEANTPAHEKEIIDYLASKKYALLTTLGVNLVFHSKDETVKEITVDCIPMVQHHPLGKAFTIQATTAPKTNDQNAHLIARAFRKVKRIFSR